MTNWQTTVDSRGLMLAEEFGIDFVHRLEVGAIREVDGALDHLREARAGALQNRLGVVQDQARLMLDIAQRHLVGAGIDGHLSRYVDKAAGFDGRRIRTARHGNARRTESLDHALVSLRFQKSFGFDRRHATRARRRDGLPVDPVLHIPRMEDAGYIGSRAALRQDVAIFIGQDLAAKHRGVGNVADGHEETVDILIPDVMGDHIAQFHAGDDGPFRRRRRRRPPCR